MVSLVCSQLYKCSKYKTCDVTNMSLTSEIEWQSHNHNGKIVKKRCSDIVSYEMLYITACTVVQAVV